MRYAAALLAVVALPVTGQGSSPAARFWMLSPWQFTAGEAVATPDSVFGVWATAEPQSLPLLIRCTATKGDTARKWVMIISVADSEAPFTVQLINEPWTRLSFRLDGHIKDSAVVHVEPKVSGRHTMLYWTIDRDRVDSLQKTVTLRVAFPRVRERSDVWYVYALPANNAAELFELAVRCDLAFTR